MLGLDLVTMSSNVVFLITKTPETRFCVLKSKSKRNALPPDSTQIFQENIMTYNLNRPVELESCSLFSWWYDLCPKPKHPKLSIIKINGYKKYARKRKLPAVIRLPKFAKTSDAYYYSLLFLTVAHRDEKELVRNYPDAKTSFCAKLSDRNNDVCMQIAHLSEEIESALLHIRMTASESGNLQIGNINETNLEMANVSFPIPQHVENAMSQCGENSTFHSMNSSESIQIHTFDVGSLTIHALQEKIRQMTPDQRQVYNTVMSKIQNPTQMKIFILGAGGVGKSFLIALLSHS